MPYLTKIIRVGIVVSLILIIVIISVYFIIFCGDSYHFFLVEQHSNQLICVSHCQLFSGRHNLAHSLLPLAPSRHH